MTARLPLVISTRALIPGTRHALVTDRSDLAVGERIVVVLDHGDGSIAPVGTTATIRGLDRREVGVVIDVVGEALVSVSPTLGGAEIAPVDPVAVPSTGLVADAQAALRMYQAARAEAGLGGDIHVTLAPDPVAASHQVASHLEISWPEVQDIFEAGGAAERLQREIRVLQRETALLRAVLGRSV